MNIASILDESVVDGQGIRVVVFFQGCRHMCVGCHNPALLPFAGGDAYTVGEIGEKILGYLTKLHRGVTFSGGDPVFQAEELEQLINYLRARQPELNIWLYTGFTYEEIKEASFLQGVDVLVDGRFEVAKKDLTLKFRGSSNQRIIDVQKSLQKNEIIELAI